MRVFTYGVEDRYINGLKRKFGAAEYVDVTEQYQDIMALNADVVIVAMDHVSDQELQAVKAYVREVGEYEDRQYFFVSDEELQRWNRQRVELHCRSVYSEMDGVSPVKYIVEYAAKNEMTAVTIMDHNTVAGYPQAEYFARQNGNLKMIYGMDAEAVNASNLENERYKAEDKPFDVTFLVRNEEGKKNLYSLKSISEEQRKGGSLRVLWNNIEKYRKGLFVGSPCEYGELYLAVLNQESDEVLEEIASRYDYIEIQPVENSLYFMEEAEMSREKALEYLRACDKKIIQIAEKLGKLVVATSNVHFVTAEESTVRAVLQRYVGYENDEQEDTHFMTTQEMLDSFSYLGSEKAWEIVVENSNKIAEKIERIQIASKMRNDYPVIEAADIRLKDICSKRLYEMYQNDIPQEYLDQLDWELQSLAESGATSALLITKELVDESGLSSYEIGYRGCLGGLLTAYLCGTTCVDPLNSRFMLYPEFAIGLDGKKWPEINLNFPTETRNEMWEACCGCLENVGAAIHAGVTDTMSEQEAAKAVAEYEKYHEVGFGDDMREWLIERLTDVVKRHTMHPGAMLFVPEGHEITEFTPLTKPESGKALVTDIGFHDLDNLLWIRVLKHDHVSMLHRLTNEIGVNVEKISLDDPAVGAVIGGRGDVSADGIQGMDSEYIRTIAREMNVETFTDVVQLLCLAHGTGVWEGNMEELICCCGFTKDNILASREDIFECLLALGFSRDEAFQITEYVRKGQARNKTEKWMQYKKKMIEVDAPEYFIDACEKVRYMFPRACAYIYALHIWWLAWFKLYFPLEFQRTRIELLCTK